MHLGYQVNSEGPPAAGTTNILEQVSNFEGPPAAGTANILEQIPNFEGRPATNAANILEQIPNSEGPPAPSTANILEQIPNPEGPPATSAANILEQIPKGPVNMSDLLSKLVQTGLLPQQQPKENIEAPQPNPPFTNVMQPVNSMDDHLPPAIRMNPTLRIPDLHLKIPHLKQ